MNKVLLSFIFLTFSAQSFALSNIVCGKKVNFDDWSVNGFELELSASNEDYSGPLSDKGDWSLKLRDKNADWIKPTNKITAKNYENENGSTVVEILIVRGKSPTGIVGVRYKLIGLYNEEPVLEKYSVGGAVGNRKLGTFPCMAAID